jgi:DNA adenine methylase
MRPDLAVLGDINGELMQAYEMLALHPRKLAREAQALIESGADYYAIRQLDPASLAPVARAARFVYLNRNCFNGLYRTNRNGEFNVPRGSNMGTLPSEQHFYRCAFALRKAQLRVRDYSETIADAGKRDFVYMDPPYKTTRRVHGEYGYGVFSVVDLPRLADDAQQLVRKGASVVISYAVDEGLLGLLPGWQKRTVKVWRGMAGTPAHRSMVREMILTSEVS